VIFPKKHPDIFTQNLAELFNKAFLSRTENWTLQVLLTFEKLMGKRNFLKTAGITALAAMAAGKLNASNSGHPDIGETEDTNEGEKSKVFMTTDISPAGLALVYNALEKPLSGKVAVKVSTGDSGGHYFLSSGLIGDLVQSVNGTIVECNTAYGGQRTNTARHKQVVAEHIYSHCSRLYHGRRWLHEPAFCKREKHHILQWLESLNITPDNSVSSFKLSGGGGTEKPRL
jgi:hypothetical protein